MRIDRSSSTVNRYYASVDRAARGHARGDPGDGRVDRARHTLIVWGNELGRGDHSLSNVPIVLRRRPARRGLVARQARRRRVAAVPASRLPRSPLDGVQSEGFGDSNSCGPSRVSEVVSGSLLSFDVKEARHDFSSTASGALFGLVLVADTHPNIAAAKEDEGVIEPQADAILHRMSDYLRGPPSVSHRDERHRRGKVTTEHQKIQEVKESKVAVRARQAPRGIAPARKGHAVFPR